MSSFQIVIKHPPYDGSNQTINKNHDKKMTEKVRNIIQRLKQKAKYLPQDNYTREKGANKEALKAGKLSGGPDGTRTRDPRRDRPVF